MKTAKRVFCSFCSSSDLDVSAMIVGLSVAICDKCIAICNEVLAERRVPGEIEYASWDLSNSKTPNVM